MHLKRWETIISDCDGLFFTRLLDEGVSDWGMDFSFLIHDRQRREYEVAFSQQPCLYVVVDEEHLSKYGVICDKSIGWTFTVEGSTLASQYPGVLEESRLRHYVVATYDVCLEILSEQEPSIRPYSPARDQ